MVEAGESVAHRDSSISFGLLLKALSRVYLGDFIPNGYRYLHLLDRLASHSRISHQLYPLRCSAATRG